MADDNDAPVLELRGILHPDGFELLRVHERPPSVAERHAREAAPSQDATARLTDQDGRTVSRGWVGGAATTYDDAGWRLLDARSHLVRVLLPLPGDKGRRAALWAEILLGPEVVWREPVGPHRPGLAVTAELVEQALRVRSESDVDAPVDVLLRARDGSSCLRMAASVDGGSVDLPLDSLPGGPAIVVVRVASGLRESVAESDPVDLPPRHPTVQVRLERLQAPVGQPVTAFASVVDSWGMLHPADDVRWMTDDEVVGIGAIAALQLPVGTHRIRVESGHLEPADVELTITGEPTDQGPATGA